MHVRAVRNLMPGRHWILIGLVAALPVSAAVSKPAEPYVNPYLAASSYSVTHARSDFTAVPGPTGPGRRLRSDEIHWKKIGPVNAFSPLYSAPYPNGKRVIWVGGYDRVAKLDADTLEVLSTYAIGGNTFFGEDEIERHVATMDRLDDEGLVNYNLKLWTDLWPSVTSAYRLLSSDNELYLPYRAPDGSISLRVYGEADAANPASAIQLRREWKIPATVSRASVFGLQMTSDGEVVMVTMDGMLIALSRDLASYQILQLPSRDGERPSQDFFSAFVRNGLSVDDRGGIYVVTRDNMHRVQWTGSRLSLDEADGAWSAPYPNEKGIGSGTTPALMGWGPQEDHLVVIADASRGNNMMAFWRDEIPSDWKGFPGMNRRVAGQTAVHFGVSAEEEAQVENALVVYGYGAFLNNTYPVQHLPSHGGPSRQWMAESLYMHVPGHEARGGTLIRWDPEARVLRTDWQTSTNFVSTVCTISGATELLYCWGARNREWTLEGTDWWTGKTAFTHILGRSHRFNPLGMPIILAPNGSVDCGCGIGLGLVRVRPSVLPEHGNAGAK